MANIFGIATALVLLISAFVAYKNKTAVENELATGKTAAATLAQSQSDLKDAQALLKQLPDDLAVVETEATELSQQEEAQKKTNEDLKAQKETVTASIEANKAKLTAIREQTGQAGDVKELVTQLKLAAQDLTTLTQDVADAEAKLANLTAQSNQAKSAVNALKLEQDRQANNESATTLNTRIRSYYPTWGFVTLAGGNNAGVVGKSTLDVVRDGQTIAKLLVTTVESSTASASIIPESMAPDTVLQVGDRVVPGLKMDKTPAAPAAPAASNN